MEDLNKQLNDLWTAIHTSFTKVDSPEIRELLYCATIFLREAVKITCGEDEPRSSAEIAGELIASRDKRIDLYRATQGEGPSQTNWDGFSRN